mmetsp:Transcript_20566/g.37114  ORF Transcript_20566/g.37114 Transcript_20566/m.37114 type:complete len:88 (+) Transcript_20566:54-317(+)
MQLLKPFVTQSSINQTYLSDHTLRMVTQIHIGQRSSTNLLTYLSLNADGSASTKDIAMKKILLSRTHFDMKPFYEWEDMEMLPLAVS